MKEEKEQAKQQEQSEEANNEAADNNSIDNASEEGLLQEPIDTSSEVDLLKIQLAEAQDKLLRKIAEFDNFKKRNSRERIELIQTAGKEVLLDLLSVLDDCERAEKQMEFNQDATQIKEGVNLVFTKLKNTLAARGLKPMESQHQVFNPDIHEAITEIAALQEDLKGKVIDEIEKGYYLNDKIIRFAKVIVGK